LTAGVIMITVGADIIRTFVSWIGLQSLRHLRCHLLLHKGGIALRVAW